MMRFVHLFLLGLAAAGLLLGACSPVEDAVPVPGASVKPMLTPYRTPTHTATAAPPDAATETPPLPPTPTPRIHTVKAGETLLLIAAQYGLTYESILSANPSISPSMLSIGEQLLIPEGSAASLSGAVFTPQPLTLFGQSCYATVEGGAWCLALVKNESPAEVEGVVLEMRLVTAQGELISGKQVPAPLNVLPSGGSLPAGYYFPPPLPDAYQLQVDLKYAVPYAGDGRYLPVTLVIDEQTLSENGLQAVIKGVVIVENPERMVQLSVLAAAYGVGDELVGMRVWQQAFPQGSGGEIPYEIMLYSLAGEIERVDLLAEAEAKQAD